MVEMITFAAETREGAGKGPARALRRTGRVPAVIYGERKDQDDGLARGPGAAPRSSATRASSARCARSSSTARRSACCRATSSSTRSPTTRCTPTSCASRAGTTVEVEVRVVFVNEDVSPGPQARRRAQHRAPRGRAALPGRRDPDARSRSTCKAVRHRRQHPHQPRHAAGRRAADDHRPRLHRRDHLGADRGARGGRGGSRRRRPSATEAAGEPKE